MILPQERLALITALTKYVVVNKSMGSLSNGIQYRPSEMGSQGARLRKPSPQTQPALLQTEGTYGMSAALRTTTALDAIPRMPAAANDERPLSIPNSDTVPQYVWEYDKQPVILQDADPEKDYAPIYIFSARGWMNAGALFLLAFAFLFVFLLWPIFDHFLFHPRKVEGLGFNSSGQIPQFQSFPALIDHDTPEDAYTRIGTDGKKYELVFSDEFSVDGRSFYPGDDPFWEAADLHYW